MAPRRIDDVVEALHSHSRRTLPLDGVLRQAAVAAVIRQARTGAGLELLFIRRAEHPGDPWSGHMAFPGGRVDPEDRNPLSAAVREAREEVALDLDAHARLIGELSQVPASARGRWIPMVIHPFVFGIDGPLPKLAPNPTEVQEAVWVPFDLFFEAGRRETIEKTYAGVSVKLPCYRFEDRVIWGLTLKMVDELRTALGARMP